jgi:hypothetical protein
MTTTELLSQRQETHGDFNEVARIAQQFRKMMRVEFGWEHMNDAQREALDSMASKFGRIASGDPNFRDHWDDIAGYATLASLHCDSGTDTITRDIATVVEQIKVGGEPTGVDEDGERFPEAVTLPKTGKKGFFGAKKEEGEVK